MFYITEVEKTTVGVEKKEKSAIIRLGSIQEAITHVSFVSFSLVPCSPAG